MSLIQQVLPFFLIGARNTLIYCFVSFPLALLLGLLLALMRSSRIAWFSSPAKIYIEVIRGTTRSDVTAPVENKPVPEPERRKISRTYYVPALLA